MSGLREVCRFKRPALASVTAGMTGGMPAGGGMYPVGAQSYSFRTFDLEGAIRQLKALDLDLMEFCGVHFPADPAYADLGRVKERLIEEGIKVPCYGVEGFGSDAAANRRKFEFAQAIGAGILTADPAPESFDNLDELCEEFGIRIAIHNHGPESRYNKVEDTLKAVDKHSALIGACVDTGHALRSGEAPHDVIRALGSRVISLHLKDWKDGRETIAGQGALDMVAVARELMAVAFSGPIVIEYEESPDNPVPDMRIGLRNWREAVEAAAPPSENEGFGKE
ncbi:MAG: sugar phosphate isomerase/epimerase [FCB group bacterium]|nr:sugar phosphate isomerase/epimerase [FCB group bacterium]